MSDITLSIVVPALNEAKIIEESIYEICRVVEKTALPYELIVVDDGSTDATWDILKRLASDNKALKGMRLSRNFGKEQAVFAGLDRALGSAVIILDADLQHPPQLIGEMVRHWQLGESDIIRAIKSHRGNESYVYKTCSKIFYKCMKYCSGLDLENASDFVLIDKQVVNILKTLPEQTPFLRGLLAWVGFRQSTITFAVSPRAGGRSKWNHSVLIKYAISNFLAFSSLPLQLINALAFLFLLFALIIGGYSIFKYITHDPLEGFITVIIVLLFIGSGVMAGLGIIGEYISAIHKETRGRPRYISMDSLNQQ